LYGDNTQHTAGIRMICTVNNYDLIVILLWICKVHIILECKTTFYSSSTDARSTTDSIGSVFFFVHLFRVYYSRKTAYSSRYTVKLTREEKRRNLRVFKIDFSRAESIYNLFVFLSHLLNPIRIRRWHNDNSRICVILLCDRITAFVKMDGQARFLVNILLYIILYTSISS